MFSDIVTSPEPVPDDTIPKKPSPNVRLAMTAATLQLILEISPPEISTQVFQQECICFLLQGFVLKHRESDAPQIGQAVPLL